MRSSITIASAIVLSALACGEDPPEATPYKLEIPEHFPKPLIPTLNPLTAEKVSLGRHLFYDTRLSLNETQSCASCHEQARAFSDGLGRAVGSTGEVHPRSSMSLANAAYQGSLTWGNPLTRQLERQALLPLFGEDPVVELGFSGQEDVLVSRLEEDTQYSDMFGAAFENGAITIENVTRALGSFQRTLISGDSPYDRYINGDQDAIDESAVRGAEFFFGEVGECFHCHGGFNFTQSVAHEGLAFDQAVFFNNGLYNLGGTGDYPEGNQGTYDITGDERDKGRFKPPSLRNISVTAPYMHDGSLATLDDVIDHYARGGTLTENGPNAGDGRDNPNKDGFVRGFEIDAQTRSDLKAFLQALTDDRFLTDPRFGPPGD